MSEKTPRVIDAEFRVVRWGRRREPLLQPRWFVKLLLMLGTIAVPTLLLLRANGHWPFGG